MCFEDPSERQLEQLVLFSLPLFGCFGPLDGDSWPLLGCFGLLMGRSWVSLGRSWALVGRSWPLLGRSWPLLAALGRSWAALGTTCKNHARIDAQNDRLGPPKAFQNDPQIDPRIDPKSIQKTMRKKNLCRTTIGLPKTQK